MNNKNIISISLVILFFIFGLIVGSFVIPRNQNNKDENINDTFKSGWDAAKKRISDVGTCQIMSEDIEIKAISGVINEMQDDTLIIKVIPIDPLGDVDLDERIVKIDKNTKLIKTIKKDDAQYEAELRDSVKNGNINPDSPEGKPALFYDVDAAINDLKEGINITVRTSENIRNEKIFLAEEIIVR